MKFAVKAWSNGGGRARTGALHLSNCPSPIETPALLLSTRKGLPVFIAPDLLPSLPSPDSHLLQINPLHFFEGPSPKTISTIGGLNEMLGLHKYGFTATPRDSMVCVPVCEKTNNIGASFETPCGRKLITPTLYVEMISSLKPNLWASLPDEVPADVSEKRNRTSVDRTLRWLDDCISIDSAGGSSVLGAIVGGSSIEERTRCAQEVSKRSVAGFWIGGFGLGESMDERPALLKAVVDNLPTERPRHICGLELPEEILQGVAAGIDLFDSMYINHITLGGFALNFPLDRTERRITDSYQSDSTGSDNTKIDLRATIYRKDASPIVDGCSCYTCQNHTKAYINHLINTREMLALILLEIHNTHHYLHFFKKIREAIKKGEFDIFCEEFIHGRRDHIAMAAVC